MPKVEEPDLLTLLDEQEHGPPACQHRSRASKDGWSHDVDPASPYYGEWVHAHPLCLRPSIPGHSKQYPAKRGWSRELQKDVDLD